MNDDCSKVSTCPHRPKCKRKDEVKRWHFGDGTIRLTTVEAEWLLAQPGAPGATWPVTDNWAGPGFNRRNSESVGG